MSLFYLWYWTLVYGNKADTSISHYNGVIMGAIASQITSLTIFNSTVYSDADQRKHQSSASLVFVWGVHRSTVNSQHKWPVTRKCFHLMTSSCVWPCDQTSSWRPSSTSIQRVTGQQLAVGTDSHSVSTGPSRMFSVLTEGCHVGYSWEFVGTVYCTYGQSNTTNVK